MNRILYKCPYKPYCCRAPQFSYVRLLHAAPNAPVVDVYANNRNIASNLAYRQFTEYLPLLPGTYNIKIYPAGRKINPIINKNINLKSNAILTIPVIGTLPNVELFEVMDKPMTKLPDKAYVRFAHLSPNAPAVDISLPDGTKLFTNVKYKEVAEYIPVNPKKYNLIVKIANTEQVVLNVPNIELKPDRFYTVYAVGLAGGQPPLQVLIPLDGNSYINL